MKTTRVVSHKEVPFSEIELYSYFEYSDELCIKTHDKNCRAAPNRDIITGIVNAIVVDTQTLLSLSPKTPVLKATIQEIIYEV